MRQVILIFAALVAGVTLAQAQLVSATARLSLVPQHSDLLPGSRPDIKGWLGMTGMSGLAFRLDNNLLQPQGLFSPGPMGGATLQLNNLISQLSQENTMGIQHAQELVSFGFTGGELGESLWSFRIRERAEARFNLPGDLLLIPFTGNAPGSRLNFSDLEARAIHFREYSVGWNRKWSDHFQSGVRVNYLYGMEYAELSNFSATWLTDETDFSYTLQAAGVLQTSGLNTLDQTSDDLEAYLLYRDNRGWSVDLGGEWQGEEGLMFGGHVLDLGSINWTEDIETSSIEAVYFNYAGPEISGDVLMDVISGDSLEQWADDQIQQVDSMLSPVVSDAAFTAALPARVVLEAGLPVVKRARSEGRLHAMAVGSLDVDPLKQWNFSIAYNHRWGRNAEVVIAWNQFPNGFGALGAAFSLNLGPLQWYLGADNVLLGPWTEYTVDEDVFAIPDRIDVISIHTGFNLVFGRGGGKPEKENRRNKASESSAGRKGVPCENFMASSR